MRQHFGQSERRGDLGRGCVHGLQQRIELGVAAVASVAGVAVVIVVCGG
jgi:hypothetical protein